MAKQRKSSRYSRSNKRNYKMKRGGSNYDSAASYGTYVNGTEDAQFNRTFDQTGPFADRIGNGYVGAQGQWSQIPNVPSAQNLSLVQSAGKSRKKRGGLIGQVINQAVVPFGLLGLQQSYGRKKRGGKTRKMKRRRR